MNSETNLAGYYAKRAAEYERIYEKPERQEDLTTLRSLLRETLKGRDVLEVACGTGYWTQVAAQTARSIFATDVNEEVLQIARSKDCGTSKVRLEKRDAFDLAGISGKFDAGLAAFWWSHLKKSQVRDFLLHFHGKLTPGARVVFIDNNYVPGSSTPISRTDEEGNTYQERALENGSKYEVLKNFPNEAELETVLDGLAGNLKLVKLTYYWFLSYQTTVSQ
jgi:demethylmenaquinone methyltransferase/2-methoxy-6-polyprenyl-1,4-benzoquinol methylase